MAKTRRLLFLVNEALFFTTHRMPIGLAMQQRGIDVHVAAPYDATFVKVIEANGFHYHPIPLERGGTSLFGEIRLVAAIAALLMRLKPDLVHNVAMKPVIWGGTICRLLGLPAVNAITGLGYLYIREDWKVRALRSYLNTLFRYALHNLQSCTIFQNADDLGIFRERRLADVERMALIKGCGVDLKQFAECPEPPGEPVVMFPARILGDKGAREFVEAARLLREKGTTARFVMVGRTDPKNPTDIGEKTIAEWVRRGWVEWWGYSTDMPATLAKSTIVCMPSYREGLPRGLIEAAAVGRAIVTADVPGCHEVVHHEVNGLLVPVRDGAATAAAIGRLLDDPTLRRTLARRGREMAEREYSVEKFVADTLTVYRVARPDLVAA